MAAQTVIKLRRDTAANWTSTNPVLAAGEQGLETDTGRVKIGNGSTAWTSLGYAKANAHPDYETTISSASAKTLTALSPRNQFFTGLTGGQSVVLPDTSTLSIGDTYTLYSATGSATVTVSTSTSAALESLVSGLTKKYICVSTANNLAASWVVKTEGSSTATGAGSAVFGISPTLSSPTITVPALTLSTTTNATAGRLAYTGSTLRLGNGTSTVTFSDDSVNASTYAPITHTHGMTDLTGFTISGPTSGQVLSYDGSKWVNSAAPASGFNSFLLMGA